MAAVYGQQSTYDSVATLSNIHQSIEDLVTKYPPQKFPLLNRLNGKVFDKEVDNKKYEWKQEVLRAVTDALNGAISSTSATTFIATTAGVFYVDDVVQIDSEQMIVTGVASDGVTLTVIRAWASSAATHSNAATIYRVGIAAKEGADADGPVVQGLADLYNYTQILEDVVQMSGTEEEAFLYRTDRGNDNASNAITNKQQELMEMLQTALILGKRNDDTTTKRRSLGGLKYFIDTYSPAANIVSMGGASAWTTQSTYIPSAVTTPYTIAQQKLDDLIQQLVLKRANPSAIYVGYKTLRRMMLWDVGLVKKDSGPDTTRGYKVPATYLSEAGDLDIILIPGNALDDLIFVVDESKIGFKAFRNRGWFTEKMAKNGDSSKWQVLGEYTLKLALPETQGYVNSLGL